MKPINHYITEIHSGGRKVIFEKIRTLFNYFLLVICGIWAIPTIIIIRCLRPVFLVRFGSISSSRIGSFVSEVGLKWAKSHIERENSLDLYWINQRPISNKFWARMTRRNFHVHIWVQPLAFWNQIIPGGDIHHIPNQLTGGNEDIYGWLEQTHAILPFLPEENDNAKAWLRKQGWKEGDPIICLLVRDSSYLDNYCPNTDIPPGSTNPTFHPKYGYGWTHLDYRDCDIATFVPAAEWLADQGMWVFRMGKVMAKPIPSNHPRIIDYAFHPEKSDFLDIWLFANCDLCISTGTGPDAVSSFYRRPILYLNYLPLWRLLSWANATHVPKTLKWKATGNSLNLREYFNFNPNTYHQIGIIIENMTPDEVLQSVQERWKRFQGIWIDTDDDVQRQRRFWEILKNHKHFDTSRPHVWIHPEARVGTLWLRSMRDSFFDDNGK